MSLTLREVETSVNFAATRNTSYTNRGKKYLTLTKCHFNVGNTMQAG